jgi:hypothetical protein
LAFIGARVQRVPHWPCSFRCAATREVAAAWATVAADAGMSDALETSAEIHSWPVQRRQRDRVVLAFMDGVSLAGYGPAASSETHDADRQLRRLAE